MANHAQVDLVIDGITDFKPLDAGGFSDVYEAAAEYLCRPVAVKVLRVKDEKSIQRFAREAGVLGRLGVNPRIVTCFQALILPSGHPAFVMELMSGGSLRHLIDDGQGPGQGQRIRWTRAVEIAVEVARALSAAHEAGVLHLDVKPENILFDGGDNPKLADFGIARIKDQTHTKSIHLSFSHAPPEAFDTNGGRDERSDIYSLVSTLYLMVSGELPYSKAVEPSDGTARIGEILSGALTPVPGIPAELQGILTRSLDRDPNNRHQTASELEADLVGILETFNQPTTKFEHQALHTSRRRFGAILGASALVAFGSGLGLARLLGGGNEIVGPDVLYVDDPSAFYVSGTNVLEWRVSGRTTTGNVLLFTPTGPGQVLIEADTTSGTVTKAADVRPRSTDTTIDGPAYYQVGSEVTISVTTGSPVENLRLCVEDACEDLDRVTVRFGKERAARVTAFDGTQVIAERTLTIGPYPAPVP